MTNPELRAEPVVKGEKLEQVNKEELKKIREQAETDSGVKRNLEDPKYVTALNKGWAKNYAGNGHPLVNKILEFSKDENYGKAFEAAKDIQRELGFTGDDVDGVIGYNTLRAYNAMLEKQETGESDTSHVEGHLNTIDTLGKNEKKEEMNEKMSEIYDEHGINDYAEHLQGTDINENEYQNYADERKKQEESEQKTQLTSLKEKLNNASPENYYGSTENSEFGGNKLKTTQLPNGPLVYESTEGPNKGEYLNLEAGEFETKEARAEKTREGQQKKIEEGIKGKVEGQWTKVEDAEYMRVGDEVFKKSDKQIGYSERGERGNPDYSKSYEFVDKYDVAKVGPDGKIGEFSETTKKEVDIVKGRREDSLKEKESYEDRDEKAIVVERILDEIDTSGWSEAIGDINIGRIGDIKKDNNLTESQRKDLQDLGKQAESLNTPNITIREYTAFVRDPLKAAQKFASKDKPGKLPGGLGEYGVEYQKNANEDVFAYRGGSELPKILAKNGKEMDIKDYFADKGALSEISLGQGKKIVLTIDQQTKNREYILREEKEDGKVATRKIKEDGTLEQQSETPLMAQNTPN